jgi:ATP-binding cassette subfamily B protein
MSSFMGKQTTIVAASLLSDANSRHKYLGSYDLQLLGGTMLSRLTKFSIIDGIKISLMCAPALSGSLFIYIAILSVMPTLQILITAQFIDHIPSLLNGLARMDSLIPILLMLFIVVAIQWISNALFRLAWTRLEQKLKTSYYLDLVNRVVVIKYRYIEDSDSLDLIQRIMKSP